MLRLSVDIKRGNAFIPYIYFSVPGRTVSKCIGDQLFSVINKSVFLFEIWLANANFFLQKFGSFLHKLEKTNIWIVSKTYPFRLILKGEGLYTLNCSDEELCFFRVHYFNTDGLTFPEDVGYPFTILKWRYCTLRWFQILAWFHS